MIPVPPSPDHSGWPADGHFTHGTEWSPRQRWVAKLVAGVAVIAVIIVGVSMWVVQRSQKTKARNENYTFRLSHASAHWLKPKPTVNVRVVLKTDRTRVIHSWKNFGGSGEVSISRNTPVGDLVVQVETPEGWTDCDVKHEVSGGNNVHKLNFGLAQLWVDNLDGPKTELVCGTFRFPIAAGKKANFAFPCPLNNAVPVKLGDLAIGELPPLKFKEGEYFSGQFGYLVDCSGKNRYRHESVVYKEDNKLPAQFSFQGSSSRFAGSYLHKLPSYDVDYFLEAAPPTLKVETFGPRFVGEQRLKYMVVRE
jgi:hypothetical protein